MKKMRFFAAILAITIVVVGSAFSSRRAFTTYTTLNKIQAGASSTTEYWIYDASALSGGEFLDCVSGSFSCTVQIKDTYSPSRTENNGKIKVYVVPDADVANDVIYTADSHKKELFTL